MTDGYRSGFGLPADVLFDLDRSRRALSARWFFVGTAADVAQPRDYLRFELFDDEYVLLRGADGEIRCFVNRCAHQSARLVGDATGRTSALLICPNHQWSYDLNSGNLRAARMMGPDFLDTDTARCSALDQIPVRNIGGLVFACLTAAPDTDDVDGIGDVLEPYLAPFDLSGGDYKLAQHHREIVDANWLLVMINNRECCHCQVNHQGLCELFDPSSFNGATTDAYQRLLDHASTRWQDLGLAWREQAFAPHDACRVARYPMQPGFASITFDKKPASSKLIGPHRAIGSHDESTLSIWLNPNAWIHLTSDHVATNWVLPLDATRCALYTSWLVRSDAVEGVDYDLDHLTEVWRVTNAEDVDLCRSMTEGARSSHYRPGPFGPDERWCRQFCDWFMAASAHV